MNTNSKFSQKSVATPFTRSFKLLVQDLCMIVMMTRTTCMTSPVLQNIQGLRTSIECLIIYCSTSLAADKLPYIRETYKVSIFGHIEEYDRTSLSVSSPHLEGLARPFIIRRGLTLTKKGGIILFAGLIHGYKGDERSSLDRWHPSKDNCLTTHKNTLNTTWKGIYCGIKYASVHFGLRSS